MANPPFTTTQVNRRLKIETIRKQEADGDDPLLLVMAQCSEAFSTSYYVDVVMYARKGHEFEIDTQAMINTPATVSVRIENLKRDEPHFPYHYEKRKGVFQTFEHQPRLHRSVGRDYDVYTGRLVPMFAMMDKQVRYRVFENMTVMQVIKACMADFKGGPMQNYVEETGFCPPDDSEMETCVQYGESTFNFLSRLMNRSSLWYYFDHDRPGPHETMLVGHNFQSGIQANFKTCTIADNFPDQHDLLKPLQIDTFRLVTDLNRLTVPAPRLSRTSEFNPLAPTRPFESSDAATKIAEHFDIISHSDGSDTPGPNTSFVVESFPDSGADDDDNATEDAAVTMRVAETQVFTIQANSKNASFAAAKKFDLRGGDDNPRPTTFLITSMSFNAFDRFYRQIMSHDSSLLALFDDMLAAPIFGFANQFDSSHGPDLATAMSNAGLQNFMTTFDAPESQRPIFGRPYTVDGALTYLASFLPTTTTLLQDLVGILKTVLRVVLEALIEVVTVLTSIVLFLPSLVLNLFGVKNAREAAVKRLRSYERDIDKLFDNLLVRDDDGFSVSFVATNADSVRGINMPNATAATVHGPHLATVIGENGITADPEAIWADALGRVRVRFPWDRTPPGADAAGGGQDKPQFLVGTSTAWVRVSDAWAGRGYGSQFLPRIGQEVVVSFIDGDPDRPLITGRVYNADHGKTNLPFPSPDVVASDPDLNSLDDLRKTPGNNLTRSGILTRSTRMPKSGGKLRYHMLRFDDDYGKEQLLLRGEGQIDDTSKGSRFETTEGNRHELVVAGKDVNGKTVGGASFTTVGGEYDLHVGKDRYEKVDAGYQLSVKAKTQLDLQDDCVGVVQGVLSLSADSIVLQAATKITLKVGGSTVVINSSGTWLDGPLVPLQQGGAADSAQSVTIKDIADATRADPGEPPNKRKPAASGGGGGSRGQHTVLPPVGIIGNPFPGSMLAISFASLGQEAPA